MSFDDDDWGRPVQTSEFARVDQLAGHLLIVFPTGYIEHSPTRFSQPGKISDVIVCDIIDLDAADDAGNPGKIYRNTWLRPSKLVVELRPFINKKTIVRIGKGVAQNGMNAPWVPMDAFAEPGAVERARAWAQANPNFAVSTFTPPPQFTAPQAGFQQQQFTPTPGSGYQGPARQQQEFQQQYQQQGPPGFAQVPNQQQYQQPQPGYNGAPQQGYPQQPVPQQQYPQQYQQPAPQQQYQQGPPPQSAPSFPVQGAPPQDQAMLDQMRAARARREESVWDDKPPF